MNPLLKLALEVGPLMVFFFANARGEWLAALEDLTRDPVRRYEMVRAAQVKVASEYSVERLEEQVLTIFAEARQAQVAARTQEQGNGLPGPFASKAMPLQQRIA